MLRKPGVSKAEKSQKEEAKEAAELPVTSVREQSEESGRPSQPRSASDVETLAAILEQKRFHMKRGPLVWAWTILSPLLVFGTMIYVFNSLLSIPLVLSIVGFLLLTAYGLNRQAEKLEAMQAALQTVDLGPCRPGPLAELLEWPHRRVRSVARLHLLRLLPTIEIRDAESLMEHQRACLRHRLTTYNALTDGAFVGTILEALGVIGDAKALPYAGKLARGKALLWLPAGKRVRKAASTCLLRLESRIQEQVAAIEEKPVAAPDVEAVSTTAESGEPMSPGYWGRPEGRPKMRQAFLIGSWCIITPFLAIKAILAFQAGQPMAGLGLILLALLSTQLYRLTLMTRQMRDARSLTNTNDLRKVGALAEMLAWPDPHLRHITAEALARLLPQLKTGDAHLLNAKQRLSLYRMLDMAYAKSYADFLEKTLLALQQIGDVEAVPYVERLANTELTRSTQEDRVKKAASACLPFLKVVAEQNQANQTLLRAADDLAPEDLLRPTPQDTPLDSVQLLRSNPQQPEP